VKKDAPNNHRLSPKNLPGGKGKGK